MIASSGMHGTPRQAGLVVSLQVSMFDILKHWKIHFNEDLL